MEANSYVRVFDARLRAPLGCGLSISRAITAGRKDWRMVLQINGSPMGFDGCRMCRAVGLPRGSVESLSESSEAPVGMCN